VIRSQSATRQSTIQSVNGIAPPQIHKKDCNVNLARCYSNSNVHLAIKKNIIIYVDTTCTLTSHLTSEQQPSHPHHHQPSEQRNDVDVGKSLQSLPMGQKASAMALLIQQERTSTFH